MSKTYILTTSGFVLPLTAHHTPVDQSKLDVVSIFARSSPLPFDNNLAEFTKDVLEHQSHSANDAYRNYEADKSFENYMVMVDITCEVLSGMSVEEFFKFQAVNRYLSTVSFRFCLDLYASKLHSNYRDYLVMPLSARFQDPALTTPATLQERQVAIKRLNGLSKNLTWERVLPPLINDKKAFVSFFRYLFVDAY